ncbi:MAG: hypothetical protein NZ903_01815 [Candidatus Micrarchaeota archaeon]|nr:hypothetical protein [Candidatus Micrarchaeota archaeon]
MKKTKKTSKPSKQIEIIEAGLKTKFISYLMLILASSLILWFTMFSDVALIAWIAVAIIGGYVILNYELIVSKVVVILSAIAMELIVLSGFTDIFVFGSAGNVLLITFIILDIILLYALSKI